jgi:hypothetical protein
MGYILSVESCFTQQLGIVSDSALEMLHALTDLHPRIDRLVGKKGRNSWNRFICHPNTAAGAKR